MEIDQSEFNSISKSSIDNATFITTESLNIQQEASFPRKRPLHQDDPFFEEGAYEYKAAWLRLGDEDAYIPAIENDDDTWSNARWNQPQSCHQDRCHGEYTFSSPASYEQHYETNHRYICQVCKKAFPGEKWLDLHIHEIHDVMVKIKRDRGEKSYQCFVDGCDRLCSTPDKRRRHLIDKHQYPKSFNFNIIVSGVVPFATRMKNMQKEKALWKSRGEGRQKIDQNKSPNQHPSHENRPMTGHPADTFDSGSMDVDPRATESNSRSASKTSSHRSNHSRKDNFSLPPKKNSHKLYRDPSRIDNAMETDTVSSSTDQKKNTAAHDIALGRKEKKDMDIDMDQLQHSMAQLMVPRSVANKMRNDKLKSDK